MIYNQFRIKNAFTKKVTKKLLFEYVKERYRVVEEHKDYLIVVQGLLRPLKWKFFIEKNNEKKDIVIENTHTAMTTWGQESIVDGKQMLVLIEKFINELE